MVVAAHLYLDACERTAKASGTRDPHGDVGDHRVKLDVPRVLDQEEHLTGDDEAADVKEEALQLLECLLPGESDVA